MTPVLKKIHSFILSKLINAASEDDIIFSICQEKGLPWDDARSMMEKEKEEHFTELNARQLPLRSALCLIFVILGTAAVIGPIVYRWYMLDETRAIAADFSDGAMPNANTAHIIIRSRCTLMS